MPSARVGKLDPINVRGQAAGGIVAPTLASVQYDLRKPTLAESSKLPLKKAPVVLREA